MAPGTGDHASQDESLTGDALDRKLLELMEEVDKQRAEFKETCAKTAAAMDAATTRPKVGAEHGDGVKPGALPDPSVARSSAAAPPPAATTPAAAAAAGPKTKPGGLVAYLKQRQSKPKPAPPQQPQQQPTGSDVRAGRNRDNSNTTAAARTQPGAGPGPDPAKAAVMLTSLSGEQRLYVRLRNSGLPRQFAVPAVLAVWYGLPVVALVVAGGWLGHLAEVSRCCWGARRDVDRAAPWVTWPDVFDLLAFWCSSYAWVIVYRFLQPLLQSRLGGGGEASGLQKQQQQQQRVGNASATDTTVRDPEEAALIGLIKERSARLQSKAPARARS